MLSATYSSGKAEALNNLAFVDIVKMNYKHAAFLLDSIFKTTDNQVELLIADVQYMRLCQRQAMNKEFYNYRVHAQKRIARIREEIEEQSEHTLGRFLYAETEYAFVSATYYYYIENNKQSIEELAKISRYGLMQKDTAQYLNWLYQYGSGGMFEDSDNYGVLQNEYKLLLECYLIAKEKGYLFWEANALQSISEHLLSEKSRKYLIEKNHVSIGYINADMMPDSLLAGYLAQKSLEMFIEYGDVYQSAGGYRTLASCYWSIGDYKSSLFCLANALHRNEAIKQAPDLVASIHEQFSIVYSSLNDKYNSDINRNIYLDMQERTRQDMELDARASQLERTSDAMNMLIVAILMLISLLSITIIILVQSSRKRNKKSSALSKAVEFCNEEYTLYIKELDECISEKTEKKEQAILNIYDNKKRYIENLSKIFLADTIIPLIDRMANEIDKLIKRKEDVRRQQGRIEYISELSDEIDEYNAVLTNWIQLRQGEVRLHIESFRLGELFDIVRKSSMLFSLKGICLKVRDTDLIVKADKTLTLFMINTIADNARKYTGRNGEVNIYATEKAPFIEISVSDTGKGLSQEEISEIFTRTAIKSHGFGLLNCRGIINKYRKYSSIFNVCEISAESAPGKGSRFFFRLPKGSIKTLILAFLLCITNAYAQTSHKPAHINNSGNDACLSISRQFADSIYFSNVSGDFEKTIMYADTVVKYLNKHYSHIKPNGKCLIQKEAATTMEPAEVLWHRAGINTDYAVILDLRNECAVAALALHKWSLYEYNNKVYTQLFKEVSSDNSLSEYCRIMQKSETNKNIAIVILILLFVLLFIASYLIYYRKTIRRHSLTDFTEGLCSILTGDLTISRKLEEFYHLKNTNSVDDYREETALIEKNLQDSLMTENELKEKFNAVDSDIKMLKFENDRLYVSNNIIENCLSTIKHETMFYPSKIRKCLKNSRKKEDLDMLFLNDLLSYYKEMCSRLCEQAHRQIGNNAVKCSVIDVSNYLNLSEQVLVLGEKDFLRYMFELLKLQNKKTRPLYSVCEKPDRYVVIRAHMTELKLTEHECANMFVPNTKWIPLLTCRQIIREISVATNLCGCGISSKIEKDGDTFTYITLPQAIKQSINN